MKPDWTHLEQFRLTPDKHPLMGTSPGDKEGVFYFQRVRTTLRVIASSPSDDCPWDHVSVCASDYKGGRCPTWDEMCYIKGLFWDEEETVVQFHPPKSEYVNNHPDCLHLWRHASVEFPRPPTKAVGIMI